MLAADQFGDGVDLIGRERDDRGASRLARDLAVAGEFELRQPRPRDDGGARQQPLDDRAHGRSAQQQRLVAAAAMQDAVGEDMPAFEIGRDLDFIDGEERHVEIARHRLDGGDPEARVLRLDLLLAGDQRDAVRRPRDRRSCCRPRARAAAAAGRSCPEECASIRSMARCVLPVLVGPSTAVTPAPGARSCANVEGEKAIFCRCFFYVVSAVIASAAKQSIALQGRWIASSLRSSQ